MENIPVFAKQNSVTSLDAKLHSGHDPSLEHREQGTLFSNIAFDGDQESTLPKVTDLTENVASSQENTRGDVNSTSTNDYGSASEKAASDTTGAIGNDMANPGLAGRGDAGASLENGSFGSGNFSQPVDTSGSMPVPQNQSNPGSAGNDISSPSPSSVSGGGSSDSNPNNLTDEGDGMLTAPVVSAQSADGNENQAITLNIQVTADSDAGVVTLITVFGVPTGAVLSAGTNNGDGSWTLMLADLAGLTLTPPANFSGGLGLSILATSMLNGMSASNSQGLSITIEGIANTPVLSVQAASGDENSTIPLSISAALTDMDGSETLVITIGNVPAGAMLSAGTDNGNGTWTLSPGQLAGLSITLPAGLGFDFILSVTATSAENGTSASISENLAVSIGAIASTPFLTTQPASGDEATPIALTINASLSDTEGSETLSILISGVPAGAVLSAGVNNGNGSWTLTAGQLTGLTITPPPGSDTDFTLSVTATSSENGTTASISQNIFVTVDGVATTPSLSVQAANGNEASAIPLSITAALVDNDGSEVLSILISGVPAGALLSAGTNNGNGSWTLTVGQLTGLTITPPTGSDADFTLSVTAISAENGTMASVSQNLTVTVDGVATQPNLSVQPSEGNEGTPIALTINASLADNDGSETLSITVAGVPTGAVLSAGINNGNGSWTLTLAQLSGLTITPPAHSDADFTLTVTATSGENGTTASAMQNIVVTVDGIAEAPNLSVQPTSGNEGSAIPLSITASLNDTDGSETLSIVVSGVPAGAVLSAGVNNGNGNWSLTPGQLSGLTITPPTGSDTDFILTVTAVSNENGTTASTSHTIAVSVDGIALNPILSVQAASGDENSSIPLTISATLMDTDGSETLSVLISGVPTGATLSAGINNGNGSWTLTPMQLTSLMLTPPPGSGDDFVLSVTATSSENGTTASVSQNLAVTIGAVASSPFLTVQAATGNESTPIALSINASLSDTDGSETLSVLVAGVPAGAILSAGINNGNGSWTLTPGQLTGLTITPPAHSDADFILTVTATSSENGTTASVSQNLSVTVDGVATAPNLAVQAAVGNEGSPISLSISASLNDTDGSETLSIRISGVPTGAILSAGVNNGNGSWTLTPGQLTGLTIMPPTHSDADFTLTVTATSSESGTTASINHTLDVTVDGVANNPLLSVSATVIGVEDTSIPLVITANLTDTDGSEALSLVISGVPVGAVLSHGSNIGGGKWSLSASDLIGLTITPPHDFSGTFNLQVTAISTEHGNGNMAQVSASCAVTVTPFIDMPTFSLHAATGFEDQAINLDIQSALTDTDGSEILSIRISGMPTGASLSAGVNNGNGSWTLTPLQLTGLQIITGSNKADDFDLTVTATSRESDNSTATQSGMLHVTVEAVADMPTVFGSNTSGAINTNVAVTIGGGVTDTDGSENVTFIVHGVPDGFALNHGINDGNNNWTLTPSQLAGLTLIAPYNFEGRVYLSVQAVAHESEGDTELSASASFNVGYGNAALGTQINLGLGVGIAGIGVGTGVGIGINTGGLTAANGIIAMEDSIVHITDAAGLLTGILGLVSYLNFTGVPVGASFNHGTNMGGGVWRVSVADLTNLDLALPANSSTDFTLGFEARLVTAVTVPLASKVVHIVGVADVPTLSVATATGSEDSNGIALNITTGLTDLDGSETLSIVIKNLPAGFHLSAGVENADGTWSLTPGQLAGLTVIPAHNFSGDVIYTVVAVSTELEGDSSTITTTGTLHVNPVADAPIIAHTIFTGLEDQAISLNLGIAVADTDGSEHISSVTITGVPIGALLTHATNNGGGSWSVDTAQLNSVQLTGPAGWHGDLNLSVTATSEEMVGGTHANTTSSISVHIEAHADTPTIGAANESGFNNTPIGLHITAGLTDTDGSEHLSIVLGGVPDGSILSAGLNNGNGTWTLHASDLSGLSISAPHGYSGDMALTATSIATESSNGDMAASTTLNFTVHVDMPPAMFGALFFSAGGFDDGNDNIAMGVSSSGDGNSFVNDISVPAGGGDHTSNAFQDAQHQAG